MTLALHERAELLGVTSRQLVAGAAPWLCEELIATEAARDRLRAWALAGGLERPGLSIGELAKRIPYYGDDEVWIHVLRAFTCLPPPVQDYALDRTAILGIGWTAKGMTFLYPVELGARRVILVSGASQTSNGVVHTALHELAHAWLEAGGEPGPDDPMPTAFVHGTQVQALRRAGMEVEHEHERAIREVENRAEHLADRWARG